MKKEPSTIERGLNGFRWFLLLSVIAVFIPIAIDFVTVREMTNVIDPRVTCYRFKQLCDINVEANSPARITPESFNDGWMHGHGIKDTTLLSDMYSIGRAWQFFTLKKWHYMSLTTEKYFIGFAFVDLKYAGDMFFYIVDREGGNVKYEYHALAPLSMGLAFAPSSVNGCATWKEGNNEMKTCFDPVAEEWNIKIRVEVISAKDAAIKKTVAVDFSADLEEALAVTYPVNGNPWRPALVHKGAGMKARGTIRVDNEPVYHSANAIASIDWTKSHAKRTTTWRWASVSADGVTVALKDGKTDQLSSKKRRIGINFSTDVYDISNQAYSPNRPSIENAVWIDGVMIPLRSPVAFSVPTGGNEAKKKEVWKISSTNPSSEEKVEIEFTPLGARETHDNFGIVVTDFVQPFGFYKGSIRVTDSEGNRHQIVFSGEEMGVVEDHYALW